MQNCSWADDDTVVHTGDAPSDYTTSVVGNKTVEWIKSVLATGPTHPPFFAWVGKINTQDFCCFGGDRIVSLSMASDQDHMLLIYRQHLPLGMPVIPLVSMRRHVTLRITITQDSVSCHSHAAKC